MTFAERTTLKLKERNRTPYWLAKETGIDLPAIYAIVKGKRDPKASTVDKIEKALA